MRKLIGIIAVGTILTLMPGRPVLADDPPPSDMSEQMGPGRDFMFEGHLFAQADDEARKHFREAMRQSQGEHRQQRKHLEQLRLLKMLELLDLDADQEVPFLTAFNTMRREHRKVDQQVRALIDSLAQHVEDADSGDERINEIVDHVLVLESQKHAIRSGFISQARSMLTAEQLGKFVIFQKRFESELLERVGRFRRGLQKEPFGRQRQGG